MCPHEGFRSVPCSGHILGQVQCQALLRDSCFLMQFSLPSLSPQLLPGGTECRASTNECDLPEFCNGTSQFCQPDFTVQNGHPCHNQEAYCYNGVCQYYDAQCQDIFGPSKEEHRVTIFLRDVMKEHAEFV